MMKTKTRTQARPRQRVASCALRLGLVLAALSTPVVGAAQTATQPTTAAVAAQKSFSSPEKACNALIVAAERFDVAALKELLGPDADDLVVSGDAVEDKNQCVAFAAAARQKKSVKRDPKNSKRAILSVGNGAWPFPIPVVATCGKWRFDANAGREEILLRRIGGNELDAIEVCRGFVEAQHEYASVKHDGAVNQYAQRVISTPGKRDGLAWQAADGTWGGPVGEEIARAIAEGYTDKSQPYHGYVFKVLKGQGPAAPLGAMDFVVNGAMIGGFALVAAPANYEVSGVKTFIVGYDGVVYEKDLGPTTLDQFRTMDRYNPDSTWSAVASPEP